MATRIPKKPTTSKKPAAKKPAAKKPTTTAKKPTATKKVVTAKKTTPTKSVVRKKPIGKKSPAKKKVISELLNNEPDKIRVKRKMYEYEKIAANGNGALFVDMGKRVQNGEMRWAYYTTEDDIGYHYYVKLK